MSSLFVIPTGILWANCSKNDSCYSYALFVLNFGSWPDSFTAGFPVLIVLTQGPPLPLLEKRRGIQKSQDEFELAARSNKISSFKHLASGRALLLRKFLLF